MSRHFGIHWVVTGITLCAACTDASTRIVAPAAPELDAVKFWEVGASTRWNERAIAVFGRHTVSNAQSALIRTLTYLSIAQHRAVLAAEAGKDGPTHPSVPAAVGAASVEVLSGFFPDERGSLETQLDADLAAAGWPGASHAEAPSGEAIGRAVASAVLAQAATDNYLIASPGTPPVGPGYWIPAPGVAPVRGLYGARPFFLSSTSQIRPAPPPAFGSPAYVAARDEIRAISDSRTPEQTALAQQWALAAPPFTAGALNLIVDGLIREHHRSEREAARILAYANAAAFDATVACSDAKFAYWFIRPSQADPGISLAIGLPNHPSYPSAHSCIASSILTVAIDAFPDERDRLEGIIEVSGLSRMYAGLHYRFDIEAGQGIGQRAAALALAGSLE